MAAARAERRVTDDDPRALPVIPGAETNATETAGDMALPDPSSDPLSGRLGLHVDFTASGDSQAFRGEGWSGQERDAVWTLGACSTMRLPPPRDDRKLILELDINPAICLPVVRAQILTVRVNGQTLGWQRVTGPTRLRCRIGPGLCKPGEPIDLTFEHPGFLRLDLLGKGGDDRALAIRFFGLRLYPAALGIEIDRLLPLRPGLERHDLYPSPAPPAAHTAPPAERVTYQFSAMESGAGAFGPREFGAGTSGRDCLLDGWHIDANGLVWSVATTCYLDLPMPGGPGPHSLRLGLSPLLMRDVLPAQRMAVIVDGLLLGQFRLHGETALSIALPARLDDGRPSLMLALMFPDAMPLRGFANGDPDHVLGIVLDWIAMETVPAQLRIAASLRGDGLDLRRPAIASDRFVDVPNDALAAAIESELGVKPAELMRGFESLGDNCAFGLAQRKAGAEILGLLRFANTPLRALLRGLEDGFKAATAKSDIELYLHPDGDPREYMLRIARYGIRWHTLVHEPDAAVDTVAQEQIMKLGFLRRKFEEGLRGGRKIYAMARSEPKKIEVAMPGWGAPPTATGMATGMGSRGPLQLMPVWDAPMTYEEAPAPLSQAEAMSALLDLNRAGPNSLLYLVPCMPGRRAGTVELLAPGLMRGHMASFVIRPEGKSPNDLDWVRVAANAWLLHRDAKASFSAAAAA